jgi:hypothetical protein
VKPDREIQGGEGRGLAFAQEAVLHAPEAPWTHDVLAWALLANSRDEDAITEAQKALELSSEEEREEYRQQLHRLTKLITTEQQDAGGQEDTHR